MSDSILSFLSKLAPFSKLPEAECKRIAESLTVEKYTSGHDLSVQGRTRLEYVYIIKDGILELFYESEGEKEMTGVVKKGEIFGGISILMNTGISVPRRCISVTSPAGGSMALFRIRRNSGTSPPAGLWSKRRVDTYWTSTPHRRPTR